MIEGAMKIKGVPEDTMKLMESKFSGPFGKALFMKKGATYTLLSEQTFLFEGTGIYIKPELIRFRKTKETRVVACLFHTDKDFTKDLFKDYKKFVFTFYVFENDICVRQVVYEYGKLVSDRTDNFR